MESVAEVVRALTTIVISGLAGACLVQWRQRRSNPAKWSALTFGVLAAVAIAGLVTPEKGGGVIEWERKLTIVALIFFPYCLHRFAAAFSNDSTRIGLVATSCTTVLATATLLLPELPAQGDTWPVWFQIYVAVLLAEGTALSVRIALKPWPAGRDQADVVRQRMRLLGMASVGLSPGSARGRRGSPGQVDLDWPHHPGAGAI